MIIYNLIIITLSHILCTSFDVSSKDVSRVKSRNIKEFLACERTYATYVTYAFSGNFLERQQTCYIRYSTCQMAVLGQYDQILLTDNLVNPTYITTGVTKQLSVLSSSEGDDIVFTAVSFMYTCSPTCGPVFWVITKVWLV